MTPAARQRIDRALKEIEQAENALHRAGEALCSVCGLADVWERLGKLEAQAIEEWHELDELEGPFRLSSEPPSAVKATEGGQ